jgi:hypothetical protein
LKEHNLESHYPVQLEVETWFLAVCKGGFISEDGTLEPKNQVSKITLKSTALIEYNVQ